MLMFWYSSKLFIVVYILSI